MLYPVSLIMKGWHLLFHHVVGLDTSLAWILSIFGLIVTVRSIIVPLSWIQYRSSRQQVNLRPVLKEIDDRYKHREDAEAGQAREDERRAAYKDNKVNMYAGCFPALVQMPFFIGLYQVLIKMARPQDGLDSATHMAIGFLSSNDVETFLNTRIFGVPMPAYVVMSPEQMEHLGTSRDAVFHFVLPMVIAAAIFTTINMLFSLYRNTLTMDYESPSGIGIFRFAVVLSLIAPLFPLIFGLTGPAPAAIVMYWFANNFWTMAQQLLIARRIDRLMPLSDGFVAMREKAKADYKKRRRAKRHVKWTQRRNRLSILGAAATLRFHRIGELRSHNQQVVEEWKRAKQERKQEKKEQAKRFRAASKAASEAKRKKKQEEKAAKQSESEESGS